ncbi:hypothetical protein [Actinokineospora inagensis]|uniref:hypothetical protein n=1 Tax=Actinokineospora inagensis TaxID=103730 RepID=UPI0004097F32|nr:hypothetical protein [Actinokineospora inagensis]
MAGDTDEGKHRVHRRARGARLPGARSRSGPARAGNDTADTADTDVLPVIGAMVRVDRPATGLAKFDLGSIPASVTPPRSWRRAAWFAVTSAMLVVIGLVYAAATLMTSPRRPDVIEALPVPSQVPPRPMTGPPTDFALPAPEVPSRPATTTTADPAPGSAAPAPPAEQSPRSGAAQPGSAAIGPVTTDSRPGAFFEPDTGVPAPSAAVRSTVLTPMLVVPANDPGTMGDRTEAYYRDVVADPTAAYALTSGQLRRQGQEQIQRRYADVRRVDVEQIVIDPTRARTRSVVKVTRKDGSVTTEQRELTFSYGTDPRITAEKSTG